MKLPEPTLPAEVSVAEAATSRKLAQAELSLPEPSEEDALAAIAKHSRELAKRAN